MTYLKSMPLLHREGLVEPQRDASTASIDSLSTRPVANSTAIVMHHDHKIDWVGSVPFIAIHVAALGVLFVDFSWAAVGLCVFMYALRMFGITGGYHRYFSHRTYKLSRVSQFFMALLGTLAAQKGVLWWAANHRHHHRFSDYPEDLHSPVQDGIIWSHVGWILSPYYTKTRWELIPDLTKYPELVWLNKYHLVPPIALAVAMVAIGGAPALFWGFFMSTVLLWHGTFTINSLSHVFGSRRYKTTDDSRNNFWLALLTLGEGWHNNHHCYMNSTRQGFFWWEIDMTYYALKVMSWFGIVSKIKAPPLKLLEAKRISPIGGA
jgi:stearoyl-CoA desaturase (delta-9 desaturase)